MFFQEGQQCLLAIWLCNLSLCNWHWYPQRNVHIWLNSIERYTPPHTHNDLDRIQVAKHFTLPDAKRMFEKCITEHGTNWITLKAKFTAISRPKPYDSFKIMKQIRNIKKGPDESLQSVVMRLEDLGERLCLDKSYEGIVQPDHGKYSTSKSIMGSIVLPNVIMGSIVLPYVIMGSIAHPPHLPSTERPELGI